MSDLGDGGGTFFNSREEARAARENERKLQAMRGFKEQGKRIREQAPPPPPPPPPPSSPKAGKDAPSSPRWTARHFAQRGQPYGWSAGETSEYDYRGTDPETGRHVRGPNERDIGINYGFDVIVKIDIGAILRKVIAFAGTHTADTLKGLAEDIASQSHKDIYVKASQQVAEEAQKAIVAKYLRSRREHARHGTPSYRTTDRFADGLLEDGLRSPQLMAVNQNSGAISIQAGVLNGYALQWMRLNYGAGEGNAPASFVIRGSDTNLASVGIKPDQRPAFEIPTGFWVTQGSDGRNGQFYPFGSEPAGERMVFQHRRSGVKIKAENWFDAGVKYIADNGGKAWMETYLTNVYEPSAARASYVETFRLDLIARYSTKVGISPHPGVRIGGHIY